MDHSDFVGRGPINPLIISLLLVESEAFNKFKVKITDWI